MPHSSSASVTMDAGIISMGSTQFVHVRRKDDGYIWIGMLMMELPRTRKQGRHKQKYMNAMREDMVVVEVTEEDVDIRTERRWKIRCGDNYGRTRNKLTKKANIH